MQGVGVGGGVCGALNSAARVSGQPLGIMLGVCGGLKTIWLDWLRSGVS